MSRWACTIAIFLAGCSGIQKSALNERLTNLEARFDHHSALVLYDVDKNKVVYNHNGDKYFTPASNTKILTFFASLNILSDSLITFYYKESGDSLLLWPAGDPTFLNPEFPASSVYDFLKKSDKEIYVSFSHADIQPFGPGWAWDDFPYTFSAERSALPIYSNYFTVGSDSGKLDISVPYFKTSLILSDTTNQTSFRRDENSNLVFYAPGKTDEEADIPFKTSNQLALELLADTLKKPVFFHDAPLDKNATALKSLSVDTVYKKLMQESNNFVAEQLILQASVVLLDSLNSEKALELASNEFLTFLPQAPVWVDGSGLSRYNLVTPLSLVMLWKKIWEQYGQEKVFLLLATGGKSGTLENYFKGEKPYIFGKTGTLSNNHNLSGYLLTKKGKVFIFSFMNNNYPTASVPVKKQMEEILWEVHLNN